MQRKHGCPSGPRGYVKAVMCSHSRVRVPLRAFLLSFFSFSCTEVYGIESHREEACFSFALFLKQLLGDLTFCVDPDCMQPNTKIPIVLGNSITNEDKERLLLRCIFRV